MPPTEQASPFSVQHLLPIVATSVLVLFWAVAYRNAMTAKCPMKTIRKMIRCTFKPCQLLLYLAWPSTWHLFPLLQEYSAETGKDRPGREHWNLRRWLQSRTWDFWLNKVINKVEFFSTVPLQWHSLRETQPLWKTWNLNEVLHFGLNHIVSFNTAHNFCQHSCSLKMRNMFTLGWPDFFFAPSLCRTHAQTK